MVVAGVAAVASGCVDEQPTTISYQVDIQPILAANCVRCHSYPNRGAVEGFRLDLYANLTTSVGGQPRIVYFGAADPVVGVVDRTAAGEMPPRFPLSDAQVELLMRWDAEGRPRGAARPGNRAPTVMLTVPATAIDGDVVSYVVDDADADVVGGGLFARLPGGDTRLVAQLASGRNEVALDLGTAVGVLPLFATLDDGGVVETVELGTIEVQP